MQIKIKKKHIVICLLICSLFLTGFWSLLYRDGINLTNTGDLFSLNVSSEHSSMNDAAYPRYCDFIAAQNGLAEFTISSAKQLRFLGTKASFNMLTAIIVAQLIWLICYSRLSERIGFQPNSLLITIILHKQDGMT